MYTMSQNLKQIDYYKKHKNEIMQFSKEIVPFLNNVDFSCKYNPKNVASYLKEKKLGYILYNTKFLESSSEAQVSENTKTIKNILNARNWLAETIKDANSIINQTDGIYNAQSLPSAEKVAKGVYNIAGVKVADTIEGVKSLQKGIYIVNGKKFFVK